MRTATAALILALILTTEANAIGYNLFEVCNFDIAQYCSKIKKTLKKQIKECLAKQHDSLLPRCQNFYKEAK